MPTFYANEGSLDLDMDLDSATAAAAASAPRDGRVDDAARAARQIQIGAGEERDADGFLQTSNSTTFGRQEFEDAFYEGHTRTPTNNGENANNEADEQHYDGQDEDDEIFEEEEIEICEDDYEDDYDYDSLEDLDHVHENPHQDCIVSNLGMKSPAIREMNENEMFAKRAGLR